MNALRNFFRRLFGLCPPMYNSVDDPIYRRYADLDRRVDNLYWRPRDLLDIK